MLAELDLRGNAHALHTVRPVPLRIAMVVEAAAGGVAVHLADLIAGLKEKANVEIHLIAPLGKRFDEAILATTLPHCTSFHRLALHRRVGLHDLGSLRDLRMLLQRLKPDIVHSHSSKAGALARSCRGSWKQVYTPHAIYTLNPALSAARRMFYGGVERVLGNRCSDALIAVSRDEADHLHELGIARARIRTIENGVAPPRLLPRVAARTALGLAPRAFVVGFVARFDRQKGVDRLVRIARQLSARYGEGLQVVAIGSGDFASAAGAEARDLPASLIVCGSVNEAYRYFSAFDLFALPSRYEGFPYVCLEAVAARVPIVATKVAGAFELVNGHDVGISVRNDDDTAEFVDAVAKFVDDPSLLARMRAHCERAAPYFSAEAMVSRTLSVYHDLMKESVF